VINAALAIIDGYHLHIQTQEAKNVKSFFSGHYQTCSINIQRACDHLCQFTYLAVAGAGVMSDRKAVKKVELWNLINNLLGLLCAIGDCAYPPTAHLIPIFGGAQAKIKKHDNFNYFASQCHIQIEMAFGLMVKKWGILNRPLSRRLRHIKFLVLCIAWLHNFCINERIMRHGLCQARNGIGPEQVVNNQSQPQHSITLGQ
jgi:DDE superfamily endonuclease